jgi:serine phosphatase RsbU (regulator of sigma subunit)
MFDLSDKIFYLIDSLDQYSFDEVLSNQFSSKYIQSKESVFLYKDKVPTFWYKITLQNNTNQTKQLILAITNPLINDITFFNTFDSNYYHTGLLYPFNQRQIMFKNYLFKIKIKPGQNGDICFKVYSQLQSEYLPISLMDEDIAESKMRTSSFIDGIFYSILIFTIFIIIILWSSNREKSHIFLLGLLIFSLLSSLWRSEYLFQYVWPNLPILNYNIGKIIFAFYISFMLLFEYYFLQLNKSNKYLIRLSIFTILISLIFSVSLIFIDSYILFYYGIRLLIILLSIITIWGIGYARNMGIAHYKQYVFAIILIVFDLLIRVFFLVESFGIGFYDTQISMFIMIIFFFIINHILIYKFKISRLEVLNLNKNLESLVEKRTQQLNSQKEELKSQHEELIQQKETLQNQREELRAKKELLELKNTELTKLSLVASKTDNLIYIFLPNGELDWFNTSFSIMFNKSVDEYKRGKPLSIMDISANKNIRHVLNTCLREKVVVSYESKKTDNNVDKWYHTTLTPILDDNEEVTFLIAIDTDITMLKQFEEELNQQRKDAEYQKDLAIKRKEELEDRQIEITDSIRYAKRIQTGIMPKVKQIARDFHDSFILFLPKDIVSGDFYWYHRIDNKYFIAAVDCTGHGVPGAFMSIIGTYLLNTIIINNGVTNPAEILKQLNRKIKIALKSDSRTQTSDGMDISIAVVDKSENIIEFASALRPVYLFSKGDFTEIKGDKIPITSSISGTNLNTYTKHVYPFSGSDVFYLFSDGIIDQFGGEKGKKFLTKRFKQLLFEINPLSLKEQKEIIKKTLDEWKGDNEQVDDILVVGIRSDDNV